MKRGLGILGFLLFLAGVFLIVITIATITGNVVSDGVGSARKYFFGVTLTLIGLALMELSRDEHILHFRSRAALRKHNGEAREAARWAYRQEHGGVNPTQKQLKVYERRLHNSGALRDVVNDYHMATRRGGFRGYR